MTTALEIAAAKTARRKEAFDARRAAFEDRGAAASAAASRHLIAFLETAGRIDAAAAVSGYRPIRTEIDPAAALDALDAAGQPLCMPVVDGPGRPLSFRRWRPGAAEIEGTFGAMIPADPTPATPRVLIVPLLAFDAGLRRLGYGGGFYDRTLARLRAADPATLAVGIAFAAQEVADIPVDGTDQRLDAVATEDGLRRPATA